MTRHLATLSSSPVRDANTHSHTFTRSFSSISCSMCVLPFLPCTTSFCGNYFVQHALSSHGPARTLSNLNKLPCQHCPHLTELYERHYTVLPLCVYPRDYPNTHVSPPGLHTSEGLPRTRLCSCWPPHSSMQNFIMWPVN